MKNYLIQIFVPIYDNTKTRFSASLYENLQNVLTDKFDGVTIYQRSPAKGLWKEGSDVPVRDDLIIFEVISESVDKSFWRELKTDLQIKFRQESLLIRSWNIEVL